VSLDRVIAARLVPRALSATWPRLGWRGFFGTDAVWRRLAWLLLRAGSGVAVAGWVWLVLATVFGLVRASVPPTAQALWRLPVAVLLVLVAFHATRGVGWLLTRFAHDLLGPSPRDLIAGLDEQAGQLRHRARLARELHDSVGHGVTVMVLQAGAARSVLQSDPAYAAEALAAIEKTGRTAMGELARVLDLLRADSLDAAAESSGLAEVAALVGTTGAAGLPVRLHTGGDLAGVPQPVSTLAYRVVQEGLTNVLRHAGAAATEVTVSVASGQLRVEVVNGPGTQPGLAGGRGLSGLAERVAALGGTLDTERRAGGGFRLRVWLPV
jgi:signal transduction histidine kinase